MINGLPEKLKSLRIQYGLSQKQVAEVIKVSPSLISGYETGLRTPSTEVLLSLSNIYNCSIDYLLGRDNKQPLLMIDTTRLTERQIQAINYLIESFIDKL